MSGRSREPGPAGAPALLGGYADGRARARAERAFDEMVTGSDVRESYLPLLATLEQLGPDELRGIADSLASNYITAGVTFDVGGVERPFPLDVIPRILDAAEWSLIERGVAQRVKVLEAFLDDVYGEAKVVADGVVPRRLLSTSTHFHRAVHGITPPNGVRVHVAGVDLIRTPDGDLRVLEDNVRVPSGVSYVMTNRSAMASALPDAFARQRIRPVSGYAQRLLSALRRSAPEGRDDPTVVVLTPGVYNSAYFEHSLLARTMGVELVEGRDLECRRGRVFMRTTQGMQRVDVIYRRIDDDFIDPVHFRADSMLGVPGLVNAVQAGGVTLANALGNGVADDKLIYTYLPDLTRYYLGEQPIIANVDTWRLEEPQAREEVMDRLEELVVKPVDGSGGKGIVIGPFADAAELDALRARVLADPRGWIAQPMVQLSTVPTLIEHELAPRHVDLRPFAVHDGDEVWVLPGGLTRVALPEGELVVNSSQGGGSKDTWVLSGPRPPGATDDDDAEAVDPPLGVGDAEDFIPPAQHHRTTPDQHSQQEQQQQTRAALRRAQDPGATGRAEPVGAPEGGRRC